MRSSDREEPDGEGGGAVRRVALTRPGAKLRRPRRNATARARPRPAPRFAFAGDRDIAVRVLEYLLSQGHRPLALLLPPAGEDSHGHALRALCPFLDESHVLRGSAFREPEGLSLLEGLSLHYVVGVHFPAMVPPEVLALPREGVLNLHPAFLPWNRGWHTPSWAILDGTPAGATLHFMDAGVDSGEVVHQRRLEVTPADTAHTLYARMKALELEVFREAWPALAAGRAHRRPQRGGGSLHRRAELLAPEVQRLELDRPTTARELLRHLRALTTNRWDEAAYFERGGRRYRVQVTVREDEG
jgi:methionyl-tRNA formyltransferase